MSGSISSLIAANAISAPTGYLPGDSSSASEFQAAAGNPNLQVDGNAIDTGRYLIISSNASTHGAAGSYANDGQVTVFDKQTNTYVNVWGDPHVTASNGNQAEFQQDGLTLKLADGTNVEFKTTGLVNGVSHIAEMAVTKNGQTVEVGNFEGQSGANVTVGTVQQGSAHAVDATMGNIYDTVLTAGSSDVGSLSFQGGSQLNSKSSQFNLDGMGGGVSQYYTNFVTAASLGAGASTAGAAVAGAASGTASGASTTAASSATGSAAAGSAAAASNVPSDLGALVQGLTTQIQMSPTMTSDQKVQALGALSQISAKLLDAPPVAQTPSYNPGGGIPLATIQGILASANGLPSPASPAATAPTVPVATDMPGMLTQLQAAVGNSSLGSADKTTLGVVVAQLGAIMTAPPPVAATIPATTTPAVAPEATAAVSPAGTTTSTAATAATAATTPAATTNPPAVSSNADTLATATGTSGVTVAQGQGKQP